ncbi:hypothetical protein ACIQYF_19570 [Pseudomonas sp. NPDC096917]|uniref:hypothetical protein n=1 Tax=Pseudomonas sp. NPDC096917 TaxID=3364483 RepID=UPI00383B144E
MQLDTFLSNDRKHIFSRCQFVFASTIIGDFDQVTLTNTMIGAFEDIITRLNKYKVKKCTLNNLSRELISLVSQNIRNSCLPIGIESFDGDQAAFFIIENEEIMALKPWNSKNISVEKITLFQYKHEIIKITKKLKN